MRLFFAPLACSLATRIALYEAGAPAEYTYVDLKSKRLPDGSDYREINPLGQVVSLRTQAGATLTESSAVLQYVADSFPAANLAPRDGLARYRLQQWLAFISTELHKSVFGPLLDARAPEGAKIYARTLAEPRLQALDQHLAAREYLLDTFSVADAYLVTVLIWAAPTGIELTGWPAVHAYHQRLLQRPSIAKAFGEELKLYREEQARRTAA